MAPCRAGFIITFGLSHKYLGEVDVIGEFLNFWEDFIEDLPAQELFIVASLLKAEVIWLRAEG